MSTSQLPLIQAPRSGLGFAKGHATGNDFVVLVDPEGLFEPTDGFVRAVCDRRRGVGGDGILRVAPVPSGAPDAGGARFFMDYRNADGSLASMCGNGARLFALVLKLTGLEPSAEFEILTRGGLRQVRMLADDQVCISMGVPTVGRTDLIATTDEGTVLAGGREIWMPNPHAVFFVPSLADAGVLRTGPLVRPARVFPDGVNVEFVRDLADHQIEMRVFERGVGETLSCGTGACAAAVAAAQEHGFDADGRTWGVGVPGGELGVTWSAAGVDLSGPATIVAIGELDEGWLSSNGA